MTFCLFRYEEKQRRLAFRTPLSPPNLRSPYLYLQPPYQNKQINSARRRPEDKDPRQRTHAPQPYIHYLDNLTDDLVHWPVLLFMTSRDWPSTWTKDPPSRSTSFITRHRRQVGR